MLWSRKGSTPSPDVGRETSRGHPGPGTSGVSSEASQHPFTPSSLYMRWATGSPLTCFAWPTWWFSKFMLAAKIEKFREYT